MHFLYPEVRSCHSSRIFFKCIWLVVESFFFGFVDKYLCFESEAGSYSRGNAGMGQLRKTEHKLYSCIVDQMHAGEELPGVICTSPVSRLNKHLSRFGGKK